MTATRLDNPALIAPPERSCFTCAHSPRHPAPAGCDALTAAEEQNIIDYCEASGANAEHNPEPGWPLIRSIACPAWRIR